MSQLLELLQEGGKGYLPERKAGGWIRIMFKNWNSLGIFTHRWKVDRLNYLTSTSRLTYLQGVSRSVTGALWKIVDSFSD